MDKYGHVKQLNTICIWQILHKKAILFLSTSLIQIDRFLAYRHKSFHLILYYISFD